jgi:sorbitol/mannitol transport system substrate-binding protein
VNFYVNLLNKYGFSGNSFNEILALINAGKCGMWIDAAIAASVVANPEQSQVADVIAFAQAPQAITTRGANWLWATSKSYIELFAGKNGWGVVPTGTRQSTYDNPRFQAAAVFAEAELKAILSANPTSSTFNPSPYNGVQFAAIPEFQAIGTAVGQQMTAALAGDISVEEALANAQKAADREMRKAGYYQSQRAINSTGRHINAAPTPI